MDLIDSLTVTSAKHQIIKLLAGNKELDKQIKFEKNQLVRVKITDFGETGEGIGRADGYTLFVKDAIVGDEVIALITKAKKSFGYARVNEVLSPSPYRINPPCENASRCGGCQIQAVDYQAQLEFKEKKVKGDLVRIGGFDKDYIDAITEPIVGADDDNIYRYRNKAQFPIGTDREGNVIAGFYAGRTHSIIPCKDCLIGITENKDILNCITAYMERNKISAYNEATLKGLVRHVLIRKGFTSGEIMVCLVLSSEGKVTSNVNKAGEEISTLSVLKNQEQLIDDLSKIPGVVSICASINKENTNVIMGKDIYVLWGKKTISDTIHLRDVENGFAIIPGKEVSFDISPLSFYQVNPRQVEKLYSIGLSYANLTGKEEVWDLCCGIGTISLCAALLAGRVHGVEIVAPAIEDAKHNAIKNKIDNADFICAPAEEYLSTNADKIKADCIIMDPPRKGMDEEALKVVVNTAPSRIVYISCDPATLARDLKYLCSNGYELKRVRPVDMFMHSIHVETVVLMTRTK